MNVKWAYVYVLLYSDSQSLKLWMYTCKLRRWAAKYAFLWMEDGHVLSPADQGIHLLWMKNQQAASTTGSGTFDSIGRPTNGILTPSSSVSASSARNLATTASCVIWRCLMTFSILFHLDAPPLYGTTLKKADADAEFAAALKRKYLSELEDTKLQCSLGICVIRSS